MHVYQGGIIDVHVLCINSVIYTIMLCLTHSVHAYHALSILVMHTPHSFPHQEAYLSAISQGQWNRRVELSGGESVIMHSQSAIVHYPSQPNGSILADDLSQPKSVLRGFAEIEKVDAGRLIHWKGYYSKRKCVCSY